MQANPHPDAGPASAPAPAAADSQQTQFPGALQTAVLHADTWLNKQTDVAPPIHTSTTFSYSSDPSKLIKGADADPYALFTPGTPYIYSRETAPNSTRAEAILASVLGAPALTYSSGLAAIFAVYTLLNPKKVAITGGYHGSHGILSIFKRLTGIQVVPLADAEAALGPGDVLHVETPVNPTGEARDLAGYVRVARAKGAVVVVDSTLAPPPLQDPFALGADLVMHSGTKYFGGHSDLLLGVLATRNRDWLNRLAQDRMFMGNVPGNLETWLAVRSLRTLGIRVERQSESATKLVAWLDGVVKGAQNGGDGKGAKGAAAVSKVVDRVFHASVQARDPDVAPWIKEQMPGGWGPLFAMKLKSEALAKKLPGKLKLFMHATSLGGVESLVEWRAMSDSTADPALLRFSVGIENWEDLRDDLAKGFEALAEEEGL